MSEPEPPTSGSPDPAASPDPASLAPQEPAAAYEPPGWTPAPAHPIQLVVDDDLLRSRLTVLLRMFLVIPHLVWLALWGIAASIAIIVAWFAALVTGRVPDGIHDFIARFQRYSVHVISYAMILANPFPGFGGTGPYPVDLEVAPAAPQSRLTVFFRWILAIPALIAAYLLTLALELLAVVAWFAALILGRLPAGLANLMVLCFTFTTRTNSYAYLLTQRYPNFD